MLIAVTESHLISINHIAEIAAPATWGLDLRQPISPAGPVPTGGSIEPMIQIKIGTPL